MVDITLPAQQRCRLQGAVVRGNDRWCRSNAIDVRSTAPASVSVSDRDWPGTVRARNERNVRSCRALRVDREAYARSACPAMPRCAPTESSDKSWRYPCTGGRARRARRRPAQAIEKGVETLVGVELGVRDQATGIVECGLQKDLQLPATGPLDIRAKQHIGLPELIGKLDFELLTRGGVGGEQLASGKSAGAQKAIERGGRELLFAGPPPIRAQSRAGTVRVLALEPFDQGAPARRRGLVRGSWRGLGASAVKPLRRYAASIRAGCPPRLATGEWECHRGGPQSPGRGA